MMFWLSLSMDILMCVRVLFMSVSRGRSRITTASFVAVEGMSAGLFVFGLSRFIKEGSECGTTSEGLLLTQSDLVVVASSGCVGGILLGVMSELKPSATGFADCSSGGLLG